jgi:hypothetical protein
MATMGFIYVDEALRLANERQAGLRREARNERNRSNRRSSRGGGGLASKVSRLGAALREVDLAPLPRLLDYSYRP